MGILTKLGLTSVLEPRFRSPTVREKLFTKYKGGRVEFVLNEMYEEPGGYDWGMIEEDNVFQKVGGLRSLADEMETRGNDVKFIVSFCHLSIRFLNIKEAVWCRMKL